MNRLLERILTRLAHQIVRKTMIYSQKKSEVELLAIGKLLSNQQLEINSTKISDFEFKIFSEHGDDGIIQFLVRNVDFKNQTFIEFGVENYFESTTRFLLMTNNWSGFILDGSQKNVDYIKNQIWYWKYDLRAECAFITKENINSLLKAADFKDLGILHIDIDGNDYHILEEIDLTDLNPSLIISEYNSVFGSERSISIPYVADFDRTKAHHSNLYFGASLTAINSLCNQRGYSLIASNSAGNNAYFLRNDLLNDKVREKTIEEVFVISKFKESRNINGELTYIRGTERLELIRGLPVINTISATIEEL
jgi:hypothetical protein